MSIKFVCSCGKHLRARDEMAARHSISGNERASFVTLT